MSRTLSAIILLFVIAGNALAGAHSATHVTANPGECELCAAYNDPTDAVPGNKVCVPPAAPRTDTYDCPDSVPSQACVRSPCQRGPPASI